MRSLLLAKSLSGEEAAREIIGVLARKYGVGTELPVATIRDRPSVNNVAVRTIKVIFPNILDIGCFSHTLHHVGEKFNAPVLEKFMKHWISLFAHSPKAKLMWQEEVVEQMGMLKRGLIPSLPLCHSVPGRPEYQWQCCSSHSKGAIGCNSKLCKL